MGKGANMDAALYYDDVYILRIREETPLVTWIESTTFIYLLLLGPLAVGQPFFQMR